MKRVAGVFALFLSIPVGMLLFSGGSEETEAVDLTIAATGEPANVPPQYLDAVMRAGGLCAEITPSLIAAQIDAESAWNPNARSPAGARGISQFMPATWSQHGRDGDGDGVADIENPVDAIYSQGLYMCSLYESVSSLRRSGLVTGDEVELTLAAYNAGIGSVNLHGGVPPFGETKNYITKITTSAATTYAPTQGAAGSAAPATWALERSGTPYRSAGCTTGACYDCCTLVHDAVQSTLGVDLPMSVPGAAPADAKCENAMLSRAAEYGGVLVPATEASLQPGDIVFFQAIGTDPAIDNVTHVALYTGNGNVVDAIPLGGVGERPLTYYRYSDELLPQAVRIPRG